MRFFERRAMYDQLWAVILAGGNGSRLKTLTRAISGDERPKQFCPILGTDTLLAHTRARLESIATPARTLFVVVREHEQFYESELANVNPTHVFVQPSNKGTTPAVAYFASRLGYLDEDAIVGFFPTDHYYGDDNEFAAAVESAYRAAKDHRESVILLGAEARQAEDGYGWIEPGVRLKGRSNQLFGVNRFWEKPSLRMAQALLEIGCLWNTFVMVGRVKVFLKMLESAVPEVSKAFEAFAWRCAISVDRTYESHLYRTLAGGDFCRQVLSVCTDRLAVLRLRDIGW